MKNSRCTNWHILNQLKKLNWYCKLLHPRRKCQAEIQNNIYGPKQVLHANTAQHVLTELLLPLDEGQHRKILYCRCNLKFTGNKNILIKNYIWKSIKLLVYHIWQVIIRPLILISDLIIVIDLKTHPHTIFNFSTIRALHDSRYIKCRTNAIWKSKNITLEGIKNSTC